MGLVVLSTFFWLLVFGLTGDELPSIVRMSIVFFVVVVVVVVVVVFVAAAAAARTRWRIPKYAICYPPIPRSHAISRVH